MRESQTLAHRSLVSLHPPPSPPPLLEEDAPPRKRRSDEDNEGGEEEGSENGEGEAEEEDIEDVVLLNEEENEDAGDPEEAAAAASEDVEEDEGVADVAGSKKTRFQRKKRSLGFYLCKIKGNVAICLFCNGGLRCDPVRFKPENVIRHWRRQHTIQLDAVERANDEGRDVSAVVQSVLGARNPANQGALLKFVQRTPRVVQTLTKLRKEAAALLFLVDTQAAFNVLDKQSFAFLLKTLGHQLPSKNTILKLLQPLFFMAFEEKVAAAQLADAISFGADLWTGVNGVKFMALTGHWMSDDWVLLHGLFGFMAVPGACFAETLHAMIAERTKHVAAKNQLIASVCSDGGADIQAARELNEADGIPCANHLLNLAINDVFGLVGFAYIADFHGIDYVISAVERDQNLQLFFEQQQVEMDGRSLVLLTKNVTRWSSRYNMLERFLSLKAIFLSVGMKEAVGSICLDTPGNVPRDLLSKAFFKRLKGYKLALDPVNGMTLALQSLQRPTASRVPGLVSQLHETWKVLTEGACLESVSQFVGELRSAVNTRLQVLLGKDSTIIAAALVDPAQSRFLANFGLADGVIESGWERIKKEIFDKLVADADPLFAGGEAQAAEYQQGLLKNLMQRSTLVFDADPLAFYRTTNLQAIAPIVPVIKMLLSLPASESDCERAFSWSGNILTKTRNRLGASTLEMVMILYDTIKNFSLPDFEAFIGRLEEAFLKAEAGGDWE